MEGIGIDAQRIVDPDRLARQLLAILVDGQVSAEVGEGAVSPLGRREVVDLEEQVARRADGPHRGRLPLPHEDDGLEAQHRGHRPGHEEQHQASVREQRGQLLVLVAIAVDEGHAPCRSTRCRRKWRARKASCTTLRVVAASASPRPSSMTARCPRPGSKNASGCSTRTSCAPRQRRGVRSRVQHTMLMVRMVMSSRNQGVEKTLKRPSRSNVSTSREPTGRPERRDGIPGLVHGGQLGGMADRVVGRGDGELPHHRRHQAGQRQQDDEHDGEAHVGQQAPGRRAHACQDHDSASPGRRSRTPAHPAASMPTEVMAQARTPALVAMVSAWSTSASRSSTSSRPTEMRTRPGGMPVAASCSALSCRWVAVGGCTA